MSCLLRTRCWPESATLAIAILLLSSCSGGGPTGLTIGTEANRSALTMALGGTLAVVLGTVGPNAYKSLPEISGAALVFVDVDVVPPFTPGGPTQRFRFRAVARGHSHIVVSRTSTIGPVDPSDYVLDVDVR